MENGLPFQRIHNDYSKNDDYMKRGVENDRSKELQI